MALQQTAARIPDPHAPVPRAWCLAKGKRLLPVLGIMQAAAVRSCLPEFWPLLDGCWVPCAPEAALLRGA